MDLSHPAAHPFPCRLPLLPQLTGMAILPGKRAEMGGGTSRAGFGVLPVTVPARLRNRTSSSRLLLAESPTFTPPSDFPVVSMFILTVRGRISALKSWTSYQPAPSPCHLQVHGSPMLTHRTELLRSTGSAKLQRAHGSPARGCSGRGFIYGRGIQLLR